jgi:endonuclease-3
MTLDYYKDASPEKIEQALMKIIPQENWFNVTYWLIDHGRAICKAQNPGCSHCPLQKLCPVSRV